MFRGKHWKYITFAIPIEKKLQELIETMGETLKKKKKNGGNIAKNISYILQFIDSASFMASSLSNLVNNLSEEIHRIKCKYGHDDKKCEICGIKYK